MFGKTRALRGILFTVVLAAAAAFSQVNPSPINPSPINSGGPADGLEFPVVMQQNVIAGKTPVGTKVQAKLTLATLVHGVVIPLDAVLTGEVTESAAKSASEPSRLGVRMDTARWKTGAAPTVLPLAPKLYVTAWYYPIAVAPNQSSDGLPEAASNPKVWNGAGIYPGQRNPNSPPMAGTDQDTSRTIPVPPAPGSSIPKHRVLMKNVDSSSDGQRGVSLTSTHANIKLDKSTTYVLAATDLLPAK
jgi:hypothetical protein